MALVGVAQWTELCPANQKLTSSISGQGICLACRPAPQLGPWEKQLIFLSFFFLLSPLKLNKILKKENGQKKDKENGQCL